MEKPAGTAVEVADESDIDAAIAAVRECGGKMISVMPVSLSLEDLFISPVETEKTAE